MVQFRDNDWWSRELKRMLEEQQPEDLHLDYKDKRSLLPSGKGGGGIDRQKRANDVSKDVSSFLNSDGGVLVYGVPEEQGSDTTGGAPVPLTEADRIGFEHGEITKETIENLITSNIQPKPGPELFQIAEVEHEGCIVFIVEIAVGVGDVWQAKDKRYYKRFHYKGEPMEHYEIDMVRNRGVEPNLSLVFGLSKTWSPMKRGYFPDDDVTIYIGVRNTATASVEAASIELGIIGFGRFGGLSYSRRESVRDLLCGFRHDGHRTVKSDWGKHEVDWYDLSWPVDGLYRPIFKKVEPEFITKFDVKATGPSQRAPIGWLLWRIQAPGTNPRTGRAIVVFDPMWLGVKIEEQPGEFEIVDEA